MKQNIFVIGKLIGLISGFGFKICFYCVFKGVKAGRLLAGAQNCGFGEKVKNIFKKVT